MTKNPPASVAPLVHLLVNMITPFTFGAVRYSALVCAIVLCSAGTALAQGAAVRPPTISRMCLWNADKAVWRALDLNRDQVRHLNVIRQRYPAVVQGVWTSGPDSVDVNTQDVGQQNPFGASSPSAQGMRAQASVKNGGNPQGPGARIEHIGLQAELREVLSDAQLRRWEELCGTRN